MKISRNHQGVVSFFTVIFLSVLLLVITTAFIRLMINSQRLAIDNDLSARAYYAAEAGVSDALVELKDAIDSGDINNFGEFNDCGAEETLDTENDISYTCQFVSYGSEISADDSSENFSLESGKSYNVDLYGAENVAGVEVSWHQPGTEEAPIDGLLDLADAVTVGQNRNPWGKNPAIIRLQAVQYPAGEDEEIVSFTDEDRSNIDNSVTFAYPVPSTISPEIDISDSTGAAECDYSTVGTDYACKTIFTDFRDEKFKFLRIRAMNNSAMVKVVPLGSDGNPIAIPNQVIIDVTGKAGDVYRRIRVKATVGGEATGTNTESNFEIDHTLLIDQSICKELEIDPTPNAGAGRPSVMNDFCPTSP